MPQKHEKSKTFLSITGHIIAVIFRLVMVLAGLIFVFLFKFLKTVLSTAGGTAENASDNTSSDKGKSQEPTSCPFCYSGTECTIAYGRHEYKKATIEDTLHRDTRCWSRNYKDCDIYRKNGR